MTDENKKSQNAEREEKILQFWKDNDTFHKSLSKESPKGNYVFYDGPPFATGLPHYGHILGSTAKDVIGRYQTMKGYRVPRRWGWDCHGLPIENIVEKDLKVSGHNEIEALGVDKFVEYARGKVLTYVHDWKKTVERIGRWVDFDGSYKTMDNTFIESVWWALGQMNDKGLLYEGVRVLAYCPRCETPIAKSEIAMDNSYKDISDISVYVKFPLVDNPTINLIAWTTTPWSLPGNIVLAVNSNVDYIEYKNKSDKNTSFIVSKDYFYKMHGNFSVNLAESGLAKDIKFEPEYEIVKQWKGFELLGKKYTPPFDYYTKGEALLSNPKSWTVVHGDFVTTTDGTGIAHEAPAFGEDDANLAHKENIPFIVHVTPEGKFAPEVTDFAGMPIKPKSEEKDGHMKADIEILKYLQSKGTLFKKEKIVHSYPHCYRCETPLFYYALPSWFINIQKVKENLLEKAESMNWIPSHLKDGRFKNTIEGAPDWNISRNRYWASPLPFWKSESGKLLFANSISDLKQKVKKSGNTYFVMRHGQAENNLGPTHNQELHHIAHLTDEGKAQVLESAQKFTEKVDLVIASPVLRVKETTEIVCNTIGYDFGSVLYDDRIREWEVDSSFDGQTKETFRHFYDLKYTEEPFKKFNDGENFAELVKRVGEFLFEVESKYKDKKILIVAHMGVARAINFVTNGLRYENLSDINDEYSDFRNAEIRPLPFVPFPHNANYEIDLHRPYIDEIVLVDESGEEYKRIPEVIDCWFESGSMPFAQDHYPFDYAPGEICDGKDWKCNNFPAGFVAEYIAQTRTWFYYTHAVSTVLFGDAPFKNVVTTGTLLAEDGQKMSKSKNNFPDPWILFDKYGVDPLRLYLMSSPLMKGEDANFSERTVQEIASKIIGRFLNVLAFYELYRDRDSEVHKYELHSENVLDRWIVARLKDLIHDVTKGMDAYDMTEATRPFDLFIDDLSTWYLRRSRERIKDGEVEAKGTLYYVLKTTALLIAPLAPFVAEEVWQKLRHEKDTESVHLADWPVEHSAQLEPVNIIEEMQNARNIVTLGLQARQKANIPVRQPLKKITITKDQLPIEYVEIIKDEINIKEIIYDKNSKEDILLDIEITPELKKEGDYRELVRSVQELRKSSGLTPSDTISLVLPEKSKLVAESFLNDMKKTVLAKEIEFSGDEIKIKK